MRSHNRTKEDISYKIKQEIKNQKLTVTFVLAICPRRCTLSYRYVVSSLEMLVAEDYLIIYMNGATPRSKMPGISWLKKCYQMIDRRWEKEKISQQSDS